MTIRTEPPLFGKRYCGDTNALEVHDLIYETFQCRIDEIISAGHAKAFSPDNLEQAHSAGFKKCLFCIGHKNSSYL